MKSKKIKDKKEEEIKKLEHEQAKEELLHQAECLTGF